MSIYVGKGEHVELNHDSQCHKLMPYHWTMFAEGIFFNSISSFSTFVEIRKLGLEPKSPTDTGALPFELHYELFIASYEKL